MNEFISKKIKAAKTLRYCLIALGAFLAVLITFFSKNENMFMYIFFVAYALIILMLIYLIKFYGLTSSVKYLKKNHMEHIINDIDFSNPTLKKSKIYCGKNAMYTDKTGAIILYGDVAWIYEHTIRAFFFTIAKKYVVFFKNGKSTSFKAKTDDIKWLLSEYIIPANPDVVIGYGYEQRKRYNQIKNNPVYK